MGTGRGGKTLNGNGGRGACPRPHGDPLPSLVFATNSDGVNLGASQGRSPGRGGRGEPANVGGRSLGVGRGQSSKVCSFCNKVHHLVDPCYKKAWIPSQS